MKILFILTYVPYPLNSGGNQATFNMIDNLRGSNDISILCYLRYGSEIRAYEELKTVWPDVTFYSCSSKELTGPAASYELTMPNTLSCRIFNYVQNSMERKIKRRMYRQQTRAIISRQQQDDYLKENSTLFHLRTDYPPEFQNLVWEVSRKGFDVVQVEFYESMSLVYLLPDDVKKVFVHHEIRYVRHENELSLFHHVSPYELGRFRYLKDMETMTLARYDHIIVLTEVDKEILLNDNPNLNVYVSPAVVAMPDNYMHFKRKEGELKRLVFVGSGDHFPNADGVLWFCEAVMPQLKAMGMDVSLDIVGVWRSKIRKKIQAVCSKANFTGFVDDLPTFLNDKVSIVPIRIGSGMRMKILDSIVAASPIVTTAKGCEGLPFKDGEDYLIADEPEDFAKAVAELLNDENLQNRLAVSIQENMRSTFDFDNLKQRRIDFYKTI